MYTPKSSHSMQIPFSVRYLSDENDVSKAGTHKNASPGGVVDILEACGAFDPVQVPAGAYHIEVGVPKGHVSFLNMHGNTSGMTQQEKRAPTTQDRAFHILKPGTAEHLLSIAFNNLKDH